MAENKRDYYEVLGVEKGASDDEIKKAYKNMVRKYHPDLNPGDKTAEEKMKEVNEAYEILSNPQKKSRYDQYGHAGVDPNFGAGGYGGGFDVDLGDLGDIFGSFFGGGFSGSRRSNPNAPMRGATIETSVTIGFEEAAFGCEREINIDRSEICPECKGSGCAPGTSPETCTECHGTGQIQMRRQTPFGTMATSAPCAKCGGRGKFIKQPCKECRGLGTVRKRRTIKASIPAGIDHGQRIQLQGQGHAGRNGGPAGDVLITVAVRPHEIFQRQGNDVYSEKSVTFTQAVLGAELEIPTIDGKVSYNLPEGTKSGTRFRLRGKGIPYIHGHGSRGDQYVTILVETPRNLTREQKDALIKFSQAMGEDAPEEKKSIFGKKRKR